MPPVAGVAASAGSCVVCSGSVGVVGSGPELQREAAAGSGVQKRIQLNPNLFICLTSELRTKERRQRGDAAASRLRNRPDAR